MKPKSASDEKMGPMGGMKGGAEAELNADALLTSARKALAKEEQDKLDQLEAKLKPATAERDTVLLDSMGRFWDRNNIPAASAIWFERKAEVVQSERSYLDAAYRYFDSYKMAEDTMLKEMMVNKAIVNYQHVLDINPGNLDAKTDLGACYVEGTAEPMKGIMMLREVVQQNPNHEMAQYNLGMLSVKSGQLDKAIERFNKVLAINPKRSEMHLYLGQVYEQKGEKENAIKEYKVFMKQSKDFPVVSEVGKMVKALESGQPQ